MVCDFCYITKEELKTKWGNKYEEYLSKIKKVVKETKNEVIVYNDEVIEAFYFSMSNGYTEDASNVFNISKPYLVSVSSTWDEISPLYSTNKTISLKEFYNLFF